MSDFLKAMAGPGWNGAMAGAAAGDEELKVWREVAKEEILPRMHAQEAGRIDAPAQGQGPSKGPGHSR